MTTIDEECREFIAEQATYWQQLSAEAFKFASTLSRVHKSQIIHWQDLHRARHNMAAQYMAVLRGDLDLDKMPGYRANWFWSECDG